MKEKRSRPGGHGAAVSRKRQKLGDDEHISSRPKPVKKSTTKIDGLGWKSISMPDKLDDYEGFLGLEEVDDVEIVRDEATGRVSFVSDAINGQASDKISEAEGNSDANYDDEGDEWTGFDNEELQIPAVKPKQDQKGNVNHGGAHDSSVANSKVRLKVKSKPSNGTKADFSILENLAQDDGIDMSNWKSLNLSPDTMASLSRLKFDTPSAIQKAAIPEILAGHDVIGKASTGSGKTLAFGIPILERFLETRRTNTVEDGAQPLRSPLALILSPTRELAHQLEKHLKALCSDGAFDGPLIATLTGGLSVYKQQRLLKNADIVIGTPGRLWEVVSGGQGIMRALKQIQFLVVDEADRLLSDGHFKEVEEILNALERVEEDVDENDVPTTRVDIGAVPGLERQTLVFSATFDRGLQTKLASREKTRRNESNLLNNNESMEYLLSKLPFREEEPKFVDVNPVNQLATRLREGLVECAGMEKDLYLYSVLLLNSTARTLVFTNSISAVRRITPFLQNLDLPALALHSGMPQKARLRSVERFTQGSNARQGSILVATDVAARGLDIPNVQLVVHYHLPRAADTYVHRSGRTARAGAEGSSILLCGPEEVAGVRRLVAKVHAQSALELDENASEAKKQGYYIRTLDLDRRIVARLKPRTKLAKQIADATVAKEKQHRQDDFFRAAAEELGVDYDSEELDKQDSGRRGRGAGRKQKEREARELSKGEVGSLRAELKALLRERVNVGVSERYLTAGNVDVDELLRQKEAGGGKTGEFLGQVDTVLKMD